MKKAIVKGSSVLVFGFPEKTTIDEVREYFSQINVSSINTDTLNNLSKMSSHCFLQFKSEKEAQEFQQEEYIFKSSVLRTEPALDYKGYLDRCLAQLLEPVRIQACGIPSSYSEENVLNIFSKFGPVRKINLLENKKKSSISKAFITYFDSSAARKCEKEKQIGTNIVLDPKGSNGKKKLKIFCNFAFPKFSDQMLKKLDPRIKKYIKSLKNLSTRFNPDDFAKIMKEFNHTTTTEQFYTPLKTKGGKDFGTASTENTSNGLQSENAISQMNALSLSFGNFRDAAKSCDKK